MATKENQSPEERFGTIPKVAPETKTQTVVIPVTSLELDHTEFGESNHV